MLELGKKELDDELDEDEEEEEDEELDEDELEEDELEEEEELEDEDELEEAMAIILRKVSREFRPARASKRLGDALPKKER